MESGRLPPETKIFFLISVLALLLGLSVSIFFEISIPSPFPGNLAIETLLLCAAAFTLSLLFFGYLSPVVAAAIGMIEGPSISAHPQNALLLLPLAMAIRAGATTGILLHKDLTGKENAFGHNKKILTSMLTTALLAIVVPFIAVAIGAAIEGDEILPTVMALAGM